MGRGSAGGKGGLVNFSAPSGAGWKGELTQFGRQSLENLGGGQNRVAVRVVRPKAENFTGSESGGGIWRMASVRALVSSSEFPPHGSEVSGLGGA